MKTTQAAMYTAGRGRILHFAFFAVLMLACCEQYLCSEEESVQVVLQDGSERTVPVTVPDAYTETSKPPPTPLVLILHGFCTPAAYQEWLTILSPAGLFPGAGRAEVLTQVSKYICPVI